MSFTWTFLTGIYSRGKSHILRLSVPIQLLLSAFANQHDEVHLKSIHFMQFNKQLIFKSKNDNNHNNIIVINMIIIHVTFIAVIIILVIIIISSISFIMNTTDIKYLLFPKIPRKSW